MRVRTGSWLAAAVLVSSSACASGGGGSAPTIDEAYGALSAESAVGQFLDAAKRSDYRLMSRLFGTRDGPAERQLGRVEVEQRMFVLASILAHDTYSLRPMGVAEGEGKQRVLVEMVGTRSRTGTATVPFITAANGGRWFVEQIMTESLTSG